ncbi:hypothetical protein [Tahibacter soli]|uniref:Delta-60 repeat protein n=1 Tax=Tahibacter soli TaxID=2983605 RepID=A0A9X3YJJ8_9GAMM|nr:hypothetical protein [Tahibacter soli]MDC8012724.1 hypothetical protein [Tahibacter soli]
MPLSRSAFFTLALSIAVSAGAVSTTAVSTSAADGTLDPGFGNAGAAFVRPDDVEARQLHPYATSVLPNGQILLGGFRSRFNPEVPFEPELRATVARLNADGSVDAGFGNASIPGLAVLPDIAPDSRIQAIHAMHVLDDGRIVAAGTALAHAPATGFVVRLAADGSVDATFGTQGFARLAYTDIHALAIDAQGRIVVAGDNLEDFGHTFGTVTRLTPDGVIDTGFAGTGTLAIDWDGGARSNSLDAVAIGANDTVVAAGSYETGEGIDRDFAVARVNADGSYDTTFAKTGHRTFKAADVDSPANHIERIVLGADGAIAFSGQYTNADGKRALVVGRLHVDGGNDTTFGDVTSPGYLRPSIMPDAFGVDTTGFLMQPDGKLVASATYYSPTVKKTFLVVRTTAAGALDATFADGGVFARDLAPQGPMSETGSMALQKDGRLVIAGAAQREEPLIDLAVVRLVNPSIAPDAIFANGFESR